MPGVEGMWGNQTIPQQAQQNPAYQIHQAQMTSQQPGTIPGSPGGGGAPAPQHPIATAPMEQPKATLDFVVQTPGGDGVHTIDNQYLFQQLKSNGLNPQSMSPDGMTMRLVDQEGEYETSVPEALQQLGYQIVDVKPIDPATDSIQPAWRAVITQLPNDDAKKQYIEQQVKELGHVAPMVQGSGRDWFVFNPQSSQWMAVTNSPDWDMSDAVEGGMMAPRAIGATAGFAAGGLPGMAAGGTAGDLMTKGMTAALSPGYRDVAGKNLGSVGADVAGSTLLDIGTMGALRGGGALLGKVGLPGLGKLATHGPISETAKVLGRGTEMMGGAMKGLGGALDNPWGREAVTAFNPLTSGMQGLGFAAQLPSMVTKGAVQGAEALGKSGWGRSLLGEESAGRLSKWAAQKLLPPVPGGGANAAQRFASRFRGNASTSRPTAAGDVFGNMFKSDSYRNSAKMFDDALTGNLSRTSRGFSQAPRASGLDASRNAYTSAARRQRMASQVGGVVQGAEDIGQSAMDLAMYPNAALIKGAKHGGGAMQSFGRGVKNAATATSPLEPYMLARYPGAEEQIANRARESGRKLYYDDAYGPASGFVSGP